MSELNYDRIYDYRFQGNSIERRRQVWKTIANWIWNRLGQPEKVLDPAAGQLEFISSVPAKEAWAVDKYQPPKHADGPKVHHVQSDIFDADLPKNYFDLVFVSNFLEHLESVERVSEFLAKMNTVLKPGGRIAIMGPNFKYCYREYFDCADHRLAFSNLAIEEFLYSTEFDIESSHSKFLPFSFRGRTPSAPILVKIYLMFPVFWRVLGKQFLVVGKKRA